MVGDFNEILHNGEKLGGPRRSIESFVPFADMIQICDVDELPSHGNGFTWVGKRYELLIQSKLDRCFSNKSWGTTFPAANQVFLELRGSDHRPVLVNLFSSSDSYRGCFRFDKRFLFKPLIKEAITNAWNMVTCVQGNSVSERLRLCRRSLSSWKKVNMSNSKERINMIQHQIETELQFQSPSFTRLSILKRDLTCAYREEETFWRQKSQDQWVLEGDQNTRFFHASVIGRRARNGLIGLQDTNGIIQRSQASMGEVAATYFRNLFTTSTPINPLQLLHDFEPRVSDIHNTLLIKRVTKEEVKAAIYSVKASSAPGADGMTGLFFQHYWEVVGAHVTTEILRFFETGSFPKEWNFTQLCLIPKIGNSTLMTDL